VSLRRSITKKVPANIEDPSTPDDTEEPELEAEPDPNPEPVTYSGTDFDVEGLVRRLNRGDIVIPTFGHGDETIELSGFQRRFVWHKPQMDRFVESLLLGYPIPGIFLVLQADKRYLVLDGQQRLRTLQRFYDGTHAGKVFALDDVGDRFKGLTYKTLPDDLRRTLDNTFIQATVVRTDGSAPSLDAVYQVFERLNSGGTLLTAHEIRVALYAGPFIDFLTKLNRAKTWRSLYGTESIRLRDQELVLRALALYVSPGTYKRPLKKYLNDFVAAHRYVEDLDIQVLRSRFEDATALLLEAGGAATLRRGGAQVNAALTEAILVGLMRRLDTPPKPKAARVATAVTRFSNDPDIESTISRATADEESVRKRLAAATKALAAA
jgi:hypothetical protein